MPQHIRQQTYTKVPSGKGYYNWLCNKYTTQVMVNCHAQSCLFSGSNIIGKMHNF